MANVQPCRRLEEPASRAWAEANDIDGDGHVGIVDLSLMAQHWLEPVPPRRDRDLNGDEIVDMKDLTTLQANWEIGN